MKNNSAVVAVREGVQADAEIVFKIRANSRTEAYKAFLTPKAWRSFEIQNAASPENLANWQAKVAEYLGDPNVYIFRVATVNNTVAGWSLSDIRKDSVHLMRLFTDPSYQGMGVGSALMSDLFTQVGDKRITLTVLRPNLRAINFYRKHGFTEVGNARYSYLGVVCVKMEKHAPHLDKTLV